MKKIQMFDSLTHPCLSGEFLGKKSGFARVVTALEKARFIGACAVGVDKTGGYAHEAFWRECAKTPALFPVAGLDPHVKNLKKELLRIRKIGYRAVKIHPRFSRFDVENARLGKILSVCAELDLVVFYCTYFYTQAERFPSKDPFFALVRALKHAPRVRMVLVHGGGTQVLRYAELVRFNPNLILDLSMTILKYEDSSVDRDIQFLFRRFDRRIAIGSDSPDFSPADLRRRFEFFSRRLSRAKKENIASKNILNFLKKST